MEYIDMLWYANEEMKSNNPQDYYDFPDFDEIALKHKIDFYLALLNQEKKHIAHAIIRELNEKYPDCERHFEM